MNLLLMKIFGYICLVFFLITLFKFYSYFEKRFLSKNDDKNYIIIEKHSLYVFKVIRLILVLFGSFESIFYRKFNFLLFIIGIILIVFGCYLRILAIQTLGQYWNFNVILYNKHKVIKSGIYRFIKHPAYIGNVYILGLFLCINSQIISLFTFIFICLFYLYRTNIENRLFYLRT